MPVTLRRRSTVVGTLAAMTFLVSPDCSALLLSRVAVPLEVTLRLVLPGSLVATGTTTNRISTPSMIRTTPTDPRTMDERRTGISASSDSEHTLCRTADRQESSVRGNSEALTGDFEALGPTVRG